VKKTNFNLKQFIRKAAKAAEKKKAEDILILDLQNLTTITDYFLICSGTSEIQLTTIARSIKEELGKEGLKPYHQEGTPESKWILLDYGGIIIHIFHTQTRQHYGLEKLWGDAQKVDF